MKALCAAYDRPQLRFTPNHCDHFLHLGLKEDVYPHGIYTSDMGWGWHVLYFDGQWKILPECGFFVEDTTVQKACGRGQAVIETIDWLQPRERDYHSRSPVAGRPEQEKALCL
jgi:hypothetical protein